MRPDAQGPGGPYPDLWVDEIQLGAFEGFQTFLVNDLDLSSSVPIMGFARTLRVIANSLVKIRIGHETYIDLTSPWEIHFDADGEQVEISDRRGSACVDLEELQRAAVCHADRVYAFCGEMCPAILENEFVYAWWHNDDYFDKPFVPQKTDRRSLTPKHPFFEPD